MNFGFLSSQGRERKDPNALLKKYSFAWGNVTVDVDVGGCGGNKAKVSRGIDCHRGARVVLLYVDGGKEERPTGAFYVIKGYERLG